MAEPTDLIVASNPNPRQTRLELTQAACVLFSGQSGRNSKDVIEAVSKLEAFVQAAT